MRPYMHTKPIIGCTCVYVRKIDLYLYLGFGPTYLNMVPSYNGLSVNSSIHERPQHAKSHKTNFDQIGVALDSVREHPGLLPAYIRPFQCDA